MSGSTTTPSDQNGGDPPPDGLNEDDVVTLQFKEVTIVVNGDYLFKVPMKMAAEAVRMSLTDPSGAIFRMEFSHAELARAIIDQRATPPTFSDPEHAQAWLDKYPPVS